MKSILLSSFVLSGLLPAATIYDEAVDGDLSDNYLNPSVLSFSPGSNIVQGDLLGTDAGRDLFTFTLSAGQMIESIRLLEYSGGGNQSILALQPGAQISSDPELANQTNSFPDPIANVGLTVATADVDFDFLPNIVLGPPFGSFNPFRVGVLDEGSYAVWLNETSVPSNYTLDFTVVPEPSSALLLGLGCVGVFSRRRR